jgi:hypothetical protein
MSKKYLYFIGGIFAVCFNAKPIQDSYRRGSWDEKKALEYIGYYQALVGFIEAGNEIEVALEALSQDGDWSEHGPSIVNEIGGYIFENIETLVEFCPFL